MNPHHKNRLYHLVGQKIRSSRRKKGKGYSQAWLAEQLELTRTSIVNIESGRQHPSLHVLWRVAEKLDMPITSLIPSQTEYHEYDSAVKLDTDTIEKIETATVNNPSDRLYVMKFVASKARAQ